MRGIAWSGWGRIVKVEISTMRVKPGLPLHCRAQCLRRRILLSGIYGTGTVKKQRY